MILRFLSYIIPVKWQAIIRNVLMVATENSWPVRAVLPGQQLLLTLCWDLPEGFRFKVFIKDSIYSFSPWVDPTVMEPTIALAPMDAYVIFHRLHDQWTFVVNRGLPGVMRLAGKAPEFPLSKHLTEALFPIWEASSGGLGEAMTRQCSYAVTWARAS